MDPKEAKAFLTSYDVFSHIIPGAIVVFALYVHERVFQPAGSLTALMVKAFPKEEMANWYYYFIATISALLAIYVIGHVVASLGSILIDRMLVNRIHEYPYKRLLETLFDRESRGEQKRRYNKAAFFIFILLNVAFALTTVWPHLMLGIIVGLAGVFFGILVLKDHARKQWPSDADKEMARQKSATEPGPGDGGSNAVQPQESVNQRPDQHPSCAVVLCEKAVTGLHAAYDGVAGGLMSLFRIGRAFPVDFQKMVEASFVRVFGRHPNRLGTNVFWLAALDVAQSGDKQPKLLMQAWHLYGLMRSMAVAFYILWLYDIIVVVSNPEQPEQHGEHVWWMGTTGLLALLCMLRYYHIYYCHFTQLVFRSFVAKNALVAARPAPGAAETEGRPLSAAPR